MGNFKALKRAVSIGLAAAVAVASFSLATVFSTAGASDIEENLKTFDDLSQEQIVFDMGAGTNLGNQFEAVGEDGYPSETAWGNPVITKELVEKIHDSGFNTIRLPVSYFFRIGEAPDYTIEKAWLDRIQEVVDYAYNLGMYVIINIHGDGYYTINNSWLLLGDYADINPRGKTDEELQEALKKEEARVDAVIDKYAHVWAQVAERYKDYDEHIIFESCNEMQSKQTGATYAKIFYPVLNRINQTFVDTVRKTGGNNAKRWLLIPGWWAEINKIVNDDLGFEIPSDNYKSSEIKGNRLFLSIHFYEPSNFCLNEDAKTTTWGSSADYANIDTQFKQVYDKFISKGYPIIIGEYGAVNKSSFDSSNTACRHDMYKAICESAKQYGLVPVAWDNGYTGDYGLGLFNRANGTVAFQEVINGIMEVYNPDKVVEIKTTEPTPSDPTKTDVTQSSGYVSSDQCPNNGQGEFDGYLQTLLNDVYKFTNYSYLEVSFTVDGEVTDETPVFNFQPFTSSYSGWQNTYLTIGDCKLSEDGVYIGRMDINNVLAHLGVADTYGINISYANAEPKVQLEKYYLIINENPPEEPTEPPVDISEFDAVMCFADGSWTVQDWETSTHITENGTYSITIRAPEGQPAEGLVVFCIDLIKAHAAFPNLTATVDSIEADGQAVDFDASKVVCGDIEGNGNFRIDIYNEYGPTKNDPAVDPLDMYFEDYLTVTFTVGGMEKVQEPTEEISEFNAVMCFADGSWTVQDWETSTLVTGDGTYSLTVYAPDGQPAEGIVVFCIDLLQASASFPNLTATLDKIEIDGVELAFDPSKVAYGDIEDNGNFRIDIYNEYGPTKDDPPIDPLDMYFEDYLTVMFTIKGMDGGDIRPEPEDPGEEPSEEPSEDPKTEEVTDEETTDAPTEAGAEEAETAQPTYDSEAEEPTTSDKAAGNDDSTSPTEQETKSPSNNAATDGNVNTGAGAAVTLSVFALVAAAGAVSVKRRRR